MLIGGIDPARLAACHSRLAALGAPVQAYEGKAYWVELVKGRGFAFSTQMPLVSNHRGHEIYRLVFFARHDLPTRLWSDVAKNPTPDLFS